MFSMYVGQKQLTQSDLNPNLYVVEASSLQLPPGRWPQRIEVASDFGNGKGFVPKRWKRRDDELVAVEYDQFDSNLTLTIWND